MNTETKTKIQSVKIHYGNGMWRYDEKNISLKLKDGESVSVPELEGSGFPVITGLSTISVRDGSLKLLGEENGFMIINKTKGSHIDDHETCQQFETSQRNRFLIRQTGNCAEVTPAYLITFEPRKIKE